MAEHAIRHQQESGFGSQSRSDPTTIAQIRARRRPLSTAPQHTYGAQLYESWISVVGKRLPLASIHDSARSELEDSVSVGKDGW
jgi:hypothetical protein